jgi:hypothetical protein
MSCLVLSCLVVLLWSKLIKKVKVYLIFFKLITKMASARQASIWVRERERVRYYFGLFHNVCYTGQSRMYAVCIMHAEMLACGERKIEIETDMCERHIQSYHTWIFHWKLKVNCIMYRTIVHTLRQFVWKK